MAARDGQLKVQLQFGRRSSARFDGDGRQVLIGLGMVVLCILAVVYLAVSTPGCSAADAAKVAAQVLH